MTRREFFRHAAWNLAVYLLAQSMRAWGLLTGKGIPS